MIYHVRNRRGEHRDENWIRFWEEHTKLKAGQCHVLDCKKDAEDGARDHEHDLQRTVRLGQHAVERGRHHGSTVINGNDD